MTYEEIRAARLQKPFGPFRLRMLTGQEYVIRAEETLLITPRNLVFFSSPSGSVVMSSADEVESLSYVGNSNKVGA